MSTSSSIVNLESTGSLTPSSIPLPSSSLCSSICSEDEIPPFELLPRSSTFSDQASSSCLFPELEKYLRREKKNKRHYEYEYDISFDPEPKAVLMPELFDFSVTAKSKRPPPSPPVSPLSRPTRPSTDSSFSSSSSSSSSETPSARSPLDSALHQTKNTLSSLSLIRSGIHNIQSSYFTPTSIPTLFPYTSSFLKSLDSFISILDFLLSRLQNYSEHPHWNPPADLILGTERLTSRLAPTLEEAFYLLKKWDGCPGNVSNRNENRRLMLGMDGEVGVLGMRIDGFEKEVKGCLSWFERGLWMVKGAIWT